MCPNRVYLNRGIGEYFEVFLAWLEVLDPVQTVNSDVRVCALTVEDASTSHTYAPPRHTVAARTLPHPPTHAHTHRAPSLTLHPPSTASRVQALGHTCVVHVPVAPHSSFWVRKLVVVELYGGAVGVT